MSSNQTFDDVDTTLKEQVVDIMLMAEEMHSFAGAIFDAALNFLEHPSCGALEKLRGMGWPALQIEELGQVTEELIDNLSSA